MGMLVEKSNLGFGMRSWRYSMLVDDCKIEEDVYRAWITAITAPTDPFEGVSDADTMLAYLKGVPSPLVYLSLVVSSLVRGLLL